MFSVTSVHKAEVINKKVNETLEACSSDSLNESLNGFVLDLKKIRPPDNYYLMKVVNIGSIHSLANTQYYGKPFHYL